MFKLVQTCGACPEQYDVYLKDQPDQMVGYLRLRHGYFRAEHMGQVVYDAYTKGDGIFEEDIAIARDKDREPGIEDVYVLKSIKWDGVE